MAVEVLLPLMGEGVHEASIVKWLKSPGERIEKDEPLLEVSTDKVDTEIPAPVSGFLKQTYVKEGEVVLVDQVLAHIVAHLDEQVDFQPPTSKQLKSETGTSSKLESKKSKPARSESFHAGQYREHVPIELAGTARSSPLVRKMAAEHGVDLRFVQGTGLHARITKDDLTDFLSGNGPTRFANLSQTNSAGAAQGGKLKADLPAFRVESRIENGRETLEGIEVRREPMKKMRRLIADHMVQSVSTSAHVTTTIEIDMHKISEFRAKFGAEFAQQHGFKLTYTPFFLHAAVFAIKQDMIFNCSVDGYDILWKDDINIGCAVAIDEGLIVPVIKKSQDLSFVELSGKLNDLASRARNKGLKPDEVRGGTFSVTNPGMFGCLISTPIINQPQVAIMSVGGIVRRAVVLGDDSIVIRPIATLGITFDHRVIDGQGGARFLSNIKNFLENPMITIN
jgi:pyruvate dehydrogenase E2 component (dihydrolipoamide acetyltransferase)